jgi:hypothetical protein
MVGMDEPNEFRSMARSKMEAEDAGGDDLEGLDGRLERDPGWGVLVAENNDSFALGEV